MIGYVLITLLCVGAWIASGAEEESGCMIFVLGLTAAAVYSVVMAL